MKPRTKEQKEVWALYNRPGYLRNNHRTAALKAWAEEKFMVYEASCCSHKAWCSCCGRSFDVPKGETEIVCPHCGKKLAVVKTRRQKIVKDGIYVQEFKTCGEWQIIRTYHVDVDCHKDYLGGVHINRVYDKWINEAGKAVVIARNLKSFSNYCRVPWSMNDYEYVYERGENGVYYAKMTKKEKQFSVKPAGGYNYSGWLIRAVYPYAQLQPWLRRYGITKDTHGFDMGNLILDMPNTEAETYWKQGQYNLACFFLYSGDYTKKDYLPSIKVARRHGFDFEKVDRMSDYTDYLRLCKQNGKDIHNPSVAAPADFNAAHQQIIDEDNARREREQRRAAEAERKRRAESDRKAQEDYEKDKAKFLNLTFQAKGLTFHVLQNVSEFYEVGTKMHICVYSASYYKKKSSLIMCATNEEGKRVEIIEVDLKGWKILQSRAACNKASERHDDIIGIVNDKMGLIKRAARASA